MSLSMYSQIPPQQHHMPIPSMVNGQLPTSIAVSVVTSANEYMPLESSHLLPKWSPPANRVNEPMYTYASQPPTDAYNCNYQTLPSIVNDCGKTYVAPLMSGNPMKPFRCTICGKNLASKSVYQLHLRSHSGEKPFTCNLCGNSFSQKTSLTRHTRSHTGERPYPCQVCGKLFADKERIKIHMRTHTGEKPFPCEVCGKRFSQKSTVKRHMTVHTGERPFHCDRCGKAFANRGNLTAHHKTHM